ncbi:MAG TPA: hypothetical protein PKZ46_01800, partial [Candidatus Cloacimonadota bacterium]|nr:hypothetical protein [Candidatus Cloacimonadota bacterium]
MPHRSEDRTIAYQLISFVFAFMLIIFLASILVTRSLYHDIMLDNQLDNMRHLAHERIYLIDGILFRVESIARISRSVFSDYSLTDDERAGFLREIMMENPQIHSICIADKATEGKPPLVMFTVRHKLTER